MRKCWPVEDTRDRILIVEFFSRGGLIHYTWQLGRAMAEEAPRAEVVMLTAKHSEAVPPAGVRVLPILDTWNPHVAPRHLPRRLVRAWRGVRYVWVWVQIVRAVGRLRPRMVLLTDLEHRCDAWFLRRLRRRCRRQQPSAALADIWHNVEPFDRYHSRRLLRRLRWRVALAHQFDTIFVHGPALAQQFQALTGITPCVIPHGDQTWMDEQAGPDPHLDLRLQLTAGQPLAMLFGALNTYKGVEVVLGAMAALKPEQRPLLLIAGMPTAVSEVAAWHSSVQSRGLEAWLRWDLRYIPVSEIAWYFRRADFVVLPYRTASQSGVAHLALTFGKPLLVTDCGGLPELIDGNGLVVPPNDVPALARAIARMSARADMRKRWAARSAKLARTRHAWRPIARTVLAATAPMLLRPGVPIPTNETGEPASVVEQSGIQKDERATRPAVTRSV